MNKFDFYLEFDGRRTHENAYDVPVEKVLATNIRQALEKFCKKKKLTLKQYEALSEDTFRGYLVKKAFLKTNKEYVYYVERQRR